MLRDSIILLFLNAKMVSFIKGRRQLNNFIARQNRFRVIDFSQKTKVKAVEYFSYSQSTTYLYSKCPNVYCTLLDCIPSFHYINIYSTGMFISNNFYGSIMVEWSIALNTSFVNRNYLSKSKFTHSVS